MKTIITCILLVMFISMAYGQTNLIKGRILNATDSTPIPNVSVHAGDMSSTSTDSNGMFELRTTNKEVTLHISHVGFETVNLPTSLPITEPLTIMLESTATQLEEVVVSTGYEDIPLERATGSFEKIDNALLNRSVSMDVLSRLENVTTGVYFDKGSANFNFTGHRPIHDVFVHGVSTMRQGEPGANAPLIILDNFPYEGDANNINPNDIESVTILKDAAAASIWGAKAGNGVIVIKSKTGNLNQPLKINFTANTTLTERPDLYQHRTISSSEYIDVERFLFEQGFYNAMETNRAKPALSPVVELLIQQRDGLVANSDAQKQIDAYRQKDIRDDMLRYVYRNAVQQQYSLGLSGGGNKHSFSLNTAYDRANASLVGFENQRIATRLENTLKPLDKLTIQTGIRWGYYIDKKPGTSDSYSDNGYRYPYISLADENGNPMPVPKDYRLGFIDTAGRGKLLDWHYQPLTEMAKQNNETSGSEIILNISTDYNITPSLTFTVRYQHSREAIETSLLHDLDSYYTRNLINRGTALDKGNVVYNFPYGGIHNQKRIRSINHNGRAQLAYGAKLHNNHELHTLGGFEIQQYRNIHDGFILYGYDPDRLTYAANIDYTYRYPVFANLASSEMVPSPINGPEETTRRFVSFFANASYSYKGKYIVSGSARRDASNLFGVATNNKWTPLWSAGFAWVLNKEPFMNVTWLSLLKLRATYGYSGNVSNQAVGMTTLYYYSSNTMPEVSWPAAAISSPPNPQLRWEKVGNLNVGVDFSLWNNRLSGSIDLYQKKTNDLISRFPLDPTTGFGSMDMNVGKTESKGIDVNIKSVNTTGRLIWTSNVVFSYNNNWVRESYYGYSSPSSYVRTGGWSNMKGTMFFPAYSYKWAGLNPETGQPRGYLNGKVSEDYRQITSRETTLDELVLHGSARPIFFGALRNTVQYDRFSLSANIAFRLNYFFRRTGLDYQRLFSSGDGHEDYRKRWQHPGDEQYTHVPALQYPLGAGNTFYQYSEVLMEPGDHIRLQDIRLDYRVGQSYWGVKQLNLFLLVNNVGILWRANDLKLDPDVRGGIPLPRSYAVGLNLNF